MTERKHSRYYKDVSNYDIIDVYRVLDLFNVTNQPIGHAIKKLLIPGGRGNKDRLQDLMEAQDSIIRAIDMIFEDNHNEDIKLEAFAKDFKEQEKEELRVLDKILEDKRDAIIKLGSL